MLCILCGTHTPTDTATLDMMLNAKFPALTTSYVAVVWCSCLTRARQPRDDVARFRAYIGKETP